MTASKILNVLFPFQQIRNIENRKAGGIHVTHSQLLLHTMHSGKECQLAEKAHPLDQSSEINMTSLRPFQFEPGCNKAVMTTLRALVIMDTKEDDR